MTAFLVSPVLTKVAPLVSKDKGSFGNRVNCAGSQAWNAIETGSTAACAVGTAGYIAKNSGKITGAANKLKNFVNKMANTNIGKTVIDTIKKTAEYFKRTKVFKTASNYIKAFADKLGGTKASMFMQTIAQKTKQYAAKAANIFKSLPKGGKIGLLSALALIVLNGVYKSGQIDQKYTDRAKMEKNFV